MLICWNYVKITVWSNWDFELLAGDWEFEKWTLGSFGLLCCAPARICKPNYWSWQVNSNWFNHPAFGSGFQIWFLKPVVRLIKTDCKNLSRLSYQILLENILVYEKADSFFITYCCFFSIVSIMLILIMSVALWLDLPDAETVTTLHSFLSLSRGNIFCCMLSL